MGEKAPFVVEGKRGALKAFKENAIKQEARSGGVVFATENDLSI